MVTIIGSNRTVNRLLGCYRSVNTSLREKLGLQRVVVVVWSRSQLRWEC